MGLSRCGERRAGETARNGTENEWGPRNTLNTRNGGSAEMGALSARARCR